MTFVISDNCIGSVDMSCLEVCPVDCIYAVGSDPEEPDQPYILVIDPQECIDCAACVQECPVEAIQQDVEVPDKWAGFTEVNAMHAGRGDNNGPAEEDAEDKADIAEAARVLHSMLSGTPDGTT